MPKYGHFFENCPINLKIGAGNIFCAANSKMTSNFSKNVYLAQFRYFEGVKCPNMAIFKNCSINFKIGAGNMFGARNWKITSNFSRNEYLTEFRYLLGVNS